MLTFLRSQIPAFAKGPLRARLAPTPLREGEAAPQWHLTGSDGAVHALSERWSLLAFYPDEGSAASTRQLQDVQAHAAALEAVGCHAYGLNPSDASSHRAFADTIGVSFPLLSDPDAAVARSYHAWVDLPLFGGTIVRTVALVNPLHKIRLVNRGTPSIAAIVRTIQALQQATRAGM